MEMSEDTIIALVVIVVGVVLFIRVWRLVVGIGFAAVLVVAALHATGDHRLRGLLPQLADVMSLLDMGTKGNPGDLRSPALPLGGPDPRIPTQLPDLAIVDVKQDPPGAVLSKNANVRYLVVVRNFGSAPCRQQIFVSGPGGATNGFSGLGPGESKTVPLPFSYFSSGPGKTTIDGIVFAVDPQNLIRESNEGNNQAGPFTLTLY